MSLKETSSHFTFTSDDAGLLSDDLDSSILQETSSERRTPKGRLENQIFNRFATTAAANLGKDGQSGRGLEEEDDDQPGNLCNINQDKNQNNQGFQVSDSNGFQVSDSSEALAGQLRVLEASHRETQAMADAKYNAYEMQIQALQELVESLRKTNLDQETVIQKQKQTIQMLKNGQNNVNVDMEKWDSQQHGLAKLNDELLQQNSQLRVECGLLKSKLEKHVKNASANDYYDLDTSESISIMLPRVPQNIKDQVERILHPKSTMLPRIHDLKVMDNYCQTNDKDPSIEQQLQKSHLEKDAIEQKLKIEKDINTELINSVQTLKQEIDNLSRQFTQLSNDAEVAVASERVALEKLDGLDRTIKDKKFQLDQSNAKYKALESQFKALEREYQIVLGANQILEKNQDKTTIDPLLFLESQWTKDRNEFYQHTTALKGSIHFLETENRMLKSELKSRLDGMPDQVEVANLVAKLALATDKIKKLEENIRKQNSKVMAFESHILKVETQLDTKLKQNKDLNHQVSLISKELSRKDGIIESQGTKLKDLEKNVATKDAKCRLESSLLQSKENILKDWKAKMKEWEQDRDKNLAASRTITMLQATAKELKQELSRKSALVKHWKDKHEELEKQVTVLKKKRDDMVDGKQYQKLIQTHRSTKDQITALSDKLEIFKHRDVQFRNSICKFIEESFVLQQASLSPSTVLNDTTTLSGLDQNQVAQMAQKLSKELLQCEWSDISMPFMSTSSHAFEVSARLKKLLDSNDFEAGLKQILTETLESY